MVKGNTLKDPEQHTQADASSKSPVLGLDRTKDVTLDGVRIQDTEKLNTKPQIK
jgi:hypothetical protein